MVSSQPHPSCWLQKEERKERVKQQNPAPKKAGRVRRLELFLISRSTSLIPKRGWYKRDIFDNNCDNFTVSSLVVNIFSMKCYLDFYWKKQYRCDSNQLANFFFGYFPHQVPWCLELKVLRKKKPDVLTLFSITQCLRIFLHHFLKLMI